MLEAAHSRKKEAEVAVLQAKNMAQAEYEALVASFNAGAGARGVPASSMVPSRARVYTATSARTPASMAVAVARPASPVTSMVASFERMEF